MGNYTSAIESLLFISGKPMTFSMLAKLLSCSTQDVEASVRELEAYYNVKERGIHLMVNDGKVQFVTSPDNKSIVAAFIKDETTGELTKASLETLTIVAYRQPITKEALEQIRGVNCSSILRNLLIRGLIEAQESRGGLTATYAVTMDFLRYLGINRVEELPDFERLHTHESIMTVLEEQGDAKSSS